MDLNTTRALNRSIRCRPPAPLSATPCTFPGRDTHPRTTYRQSPRPPNFPLKVWRKAEEKYGKIMINRRFTMISLVRMGHDLGVVQEWGFIKKSMIKQRILGVPCIFGQAWLNCTTQNQRLDDFAQKQNGRFSWPACNMETLCHGWVSGPQTDLSMEKPQAAPDFAWSHWIWRADSLLLPLSGLQGICCAACAPERFGRCPRLRSPRAPACESEHMEEPNTSVIPVCFSLATRSTRELSRTQGTQGIGSSITAARLPHDSLLNLVISMFGSAGTWKLHKTTKKKNCRGWRIGFRICSWFVPLPLENPRKFPPKSYQRPSGTANPPKANRNNRNGLKMGQKWQKKMALSETWAPTRSTSWSSMFIHENHPFSPEPRAPKKQRSDQQHSRCTTWWPSVLTSQLCPGHPCSNCFVLVATCYELLVN